MKEFIISEAQSEKAVLVGLITPQQNEQKVKEYLNIFPVCRRHILIDKFVGYYRNIRRKTQFQIYFHT